MKLHEVLMDERVSKNGEWFRPIGYPKGYAFCIKEGKVCRVPTSRGAVRGIDTEASVLAGEWEIVTVLEVLI